MTFPTLGLTGGTFNSDLPVSFKVTLDSLTGPDAGVCGSTDICTADFTSSGNNFARSPNGSPWAAIVGVNLNLDGVDNTGDFWLDPALNEAARLASHRVTDAPEPGTLALLGAALFGLAGWRRRRS
jgi:hypothetical protein